MKLPAIIMAVAMSLGAIALPSAANANGNVSWSVTVGNGGYYNHGYRNNYRHRNNYRPPVVYVRPRPRVVYVQPRPVYVRPRPRVVYVQPRPRPVYAPPRPVIYVPPRPVYVPRPAITLQVGYGNWNNGRHWHDNRQRWSARRW